MQNFAFSYPREPSLDDLSLLAEEAFARLPEPFRVVSQFEFRRLGSCQHRSVCLAQSMEAT